MRRVVPVLLLIAGCPSDGGVERVTNTDTFEQSPSNAADILWVIDASPSMSNEQEAIAAGADAFLARLETSDVDWHLGVVTPDVSAGYADAGRLLGNPTYLTPDTPDYAEAFRARARVGGDGSAQEQAFAAARLALAPPLADTDNAGFLRDDAVLYLIFVSDEDDCTGVTSDDPDACYQGGLTPVADVVDGLASLQDEGAVVISGVVGPPVSAGCADSVPGDRYGDAVDMTGGVRESICETDWSTLMDALGAVATGIRTSFPLSKPADASTIQVEVALDGDTWMVAPSEIDGWTYDASYARLDFHGDGVPPRGSTLTVSYTVSMDRVATDSGG